MGKSIPVGGQGGSACCEKRRLELASLFSNGLAAIPALVGLRAAGVIATALSPGHPVASGQTLRLPACSTRPHVLVRHPIIIIHASNDPWCLGGSGNWALVELAVFLMATEIRVRQRAAAGFSLPRATHLINFAEDQRKVADTFPSCADALSRQSRRRDAIASAARFPMRMQSGMPMPS